MTKQTTIVVTGSLRVNILGKSYYVTANGLFPFLFRYRIKKDSENLILNNALLSYHLVG